MIMYDNTAIAMSSTRGSGGKKHKLLAIIVVGLLAQSIAALAEPFAYVTNTGLNNASVIDLATSTVSATVAVGGVGRGVKNDHGINLTFGCECDPKIVGDPIGKPACECTPMLGRKLARVNSQRVD